LNALNDAKLSQRRRTSTIKKKVPSYYSSQSSSSLEDSEVELSEFSEDESLKRGRGNFSLLGTKRKRKTEKDLNFLKKELKKEFLWSREKIIAISERLNLAET
jgi:hypothetical protein